MVLFIQSKFCATFVKTPGNDEIPQKSGPKLAIPVKT